MARDEKLFAQAMGEYQKGWTDKNLMIKAVVLASRDEKKKQFEYIKLRVEQIKSENLKNLPVVFATGAISGFKAVRDDRQLRATQKIMAKEALKKKLGLLIRKSRLGLLTRGTKLRLLIRANTLGLLTRKPKLGLLTRKIVKGSPYD